MYLVERSDASHDVYPRAVIITVFALHPDAIMATIKTTAINWYNMIT